MRLERTGQEMQSVGKRLASRERLVRRQETCVEGDLRCGRDTFVEQGEMRRDRSR